MDDQIHKFEFFNDIGWFLRISNKGIIFNRETFKEYTPDDFAWEFINLLERNFNVEFTLKDENKHE